MKRELLKDTELPIGRNISWRNELRPKGKNGRPLIIVSKGRTDYKILLPAIATHQEQKAASDLQLWLKEITGVALPVIREGKECVKTRKGISIGKTEALRRNLPAVYKKDLGEEGYAIEVNEGWLYLLGGTKRGPINAVYALLEEDIGCRWYDMYSDSIPKIPDLSISPVVRSYIPPLELRDPYYWDAWDSEWSLHNRTSSPESPIREEWGGYPRYPGETFRERGFWTHMDTWFVHTFHLLVPPEKHFNKHPEYFSEIEGVRKPLQLCLTNPDVLEIVINEVRRVLRENPHIRIISVSQNDVHGHCECVRCKTVNEPEGTKAGTLIKFVNSVANAIKKEFPRVLISTLAYQQTAIPPKTILPAENVVIYLCTDSHAWGWPFLPVWKTKQFKRALELWVKTGARVYIWDYTSNYSYFPLPMPNLTVVPMNIRYYVKKGARGVMLEGYYSDNSILRSWVWAKQMWNPSLKTESLIRDFIYGYYGEAAPELWKYNSILLDIWKENYNKGTFKNGEIYHIRYTPDVPFLSGSFLQRACRLFDEAEKKAENTIVLRRVKQAKLPVLYAILSRDLGVMTLPPRFWAGKNNFLKKALKGKQCSFEKYQKMIDEIEEIVHTGNIKEFTQGYFQGRVPKGTTQAQLCINTWRSLSAGVPSFDILKLNELWYFRTDPDDVGISDGWYKCTGRNEDWIKISTNIDPGWGHQGWESVKGFENYTGYGWYRQVFWFPSEFDSREYLQMVFPVVKREAVVWINGKKVYEYTCKTTRLNPDEIGVNELPVFFDCREFLKPDSQNVVAVRVKGWKSSRDTRCGICKPATLLSCERKMGPYMLNILVHLALNIKERKTK